MNREFETTWCDYLTTCPDFSDIQIGSYECHQCPYFNGITEKTTDEFRQMNMEKCGYQKYSIVKSKGVVSCKYG